MTRLDAPAARRHRQSLLRLALLGLCAFTGVGAAPPAGASEAPVPGAAARPRRAAEPEPRRAAQAAAEATAAAGQAFADVPVSTAVAGALQRVAAQAPAPGEVYALITVSDRRTGERRVTTRGEPRPEYAECGPLARALSGRGVVRRGGRPRCRR